jgi:hypothetical protein
VLVAFCLTKSPSCKVAVIFRDVAYFRAFITEEFFKMFKEDFVHIPTLRSRILSFRPDGSVLRQDAHQCQEVEQFKVASV